MPDPAASVALVSGVAGLVLTQVGSLIPARKDFMSQIRLKIEACIESLAASHCFLIKQTQSVGMADFDNLMRGDGRISRDFFSEHAKTALIAGRDHSRLLLLSKYFRALHGTLFFAIVLLILFGLGVSFFGAFRGSALFATIFFILEVFSLVGLHLIGAFAEQI